MLLIVMIYFKEIAEYDGKTTHDTILRSLHQFNQNNQTIFSQVFMITMDWATRACRCNRRSIIDHQMIFWAL